MKTLRQNYEYEGGGIVKIGTVATCPKCKAVEFVIEAEDVGRCRSCKITFNGADLAQFDGKQDAWRRYMALPKLWMDEGLPPGPYKLAMFFHLHSRFDKPWSWYGRESICRHVCVSMTSYQAWMRELTNRKVISVNVRRGKSTNLVTLNLNFKVGDTL